MRKYYKKNKYGNKKTCAYGHKFDSKAEADYYPLAVSYAKAQGYQLELQYKLELMPKMKLNDWTIRKTHYIADYAFLDAKGNIIRLVDVKGLETPDFRLKAKIVAKEFGIVIELAKKTRKGFIHYPFNMPKNKRLEVRE